MSSDETVTVIQGNHEFQFVPPDQVRFVLRGTVDEAEARALVKFIYHHADKAGRSLYCVYDMANFVRVTEAGRKVVVHVERPYPYTDVAVIGASFTTRVFLGMLVKAGRIVASKHFGFSMEFVESMDAANAWFDELRAKRR
jgi:hypothetical protein